ncbi:hypothetical protein AAFN47_15660 [Hoeflea sp. CAU 1731]
MVFEDLITRLNMMFVDMENQPEDTRELLLQIHMELSQLRATGQPLPQDLVELEKRLEAEFEAKGVERPSI